MSTNVKDLSEQQLNELYNYDEKTAALALFLNLTDEDKIENSMSDYYTVNERPIKYGTSPEQYLKNASNLRKVLNNEARELMNIAINSIESGEFTESERDSAYKTICELVNADKDTFTDEQQDAYDQVKNDCLYFDNAIYNMLGNDLFGSYYRTAWAGETPEDTRRDSTVSDGEYLVLTDSEADKWENEYLDNLVDDVVDIPSHLTAYFDREAWISDNSGDRGSNIASYDSVEEEQEFNGTVYYIYRTN